MLLCCREIQTTELLLGAEFELATNRSLCLMDIARLNTNGGSKQLKSRRPLAIVDALRRAYDH